MNFSLGHFSSLVLPGLSHLLPEVKIHLSAVTVSPCLPLRPLFYALDMYVQMCDGHVHEANADTPDLLHPQVCPPPVELPSPYSVSCIFLKVPGTATCTWDSWVYSLPSPHTAN